jgi:hypothetical protein
LRIYAEGGIKDSDRQSAPAGEPGNGGNLTGGCVDVAKGDYVHDFVFNVVPDAGGAAIS